MILKSFSDFNCDAFSVELGGFSSMRGRLLCFKMLLQKIAFLPFAILLKAAGTCFRMAIFSIGTIQYIASLGSSCKAQELLARRGEVLAKDLADWIVFPFVVGLGLCRLFLGTTLTPAIYFQ
jgi:hypothetical protein